jgi:NAD(P)H-dependent FMN reductase
MVPRILIAAATLDFASPARKLADAAQLLLAQRGAEVTRISPVDYPLPLFEDGVSDRPFPKQGRRLAEMVRSHDGVLVASPSLHAVVPPLVVNLIAWTATPGSPWRDRAVALAATAAERDDAGLVADQLRGALGRLGADVIASQCCIGGDASAFDEDGWPRDGRDRDNLNRMCLQLYERSHAFRKNTRPA